MVDGRDGTDFIRCGLCDKHLRVISGRHLSKHGTDRETYMQEYRLSPDKLCSKSFRINHSSRRDYRALNKKEWIAAIRIVYQRARTGARRLLAKALSTTLSAGPLAFS